jgi:hypothetical protein
MDLNNFWQQNKRFVVSVASGGIVFLIGIMLIDGLYGADLAKLTREVGQNESRLRNTPMYTRAERDKAQAQNEALTKSIADLEARVRFLPRPFFRLDPNGAPAANQYFAVVSQTREDLLRSAGRANLRLPEDLGLPALSPTRDAEIAKHLEALDLVERVVRLALENGVQRIDKIEIRLDPKLNSREGVGAIERTRVAFTISGDPAPLTALLVASQEAREVKLEGQTQAVLPLPIEKAEISPARSKQDEASLEVVFLLVTLHERREENSGS